MPAHLDPLVTQRRADQVDLLEDPADQPAAITGADHELLGALAEEAALHAQVRPALVLLGVDHQDAWGADDEVVHVGSRARDASVVQDPYAGTREAVEAPPSASSPFAPTAQAVVLLGL
ncbi:MAG TPA: hypothetical protein VGN19_13060, partial [Pedococcus sp.]|nr:hypothetical protein [Pedococcus sp.]